MRKIAREIAFLMIYEEQFNPERDVELSFDLLKEEDEITGENVVSEEDEKYVRDLIKLFDDNKSEVKEVIEKHLFGYEFARVYKIDMALLNLAVTEIYFYKTPVAIVVNEVVELSKKYSTDKSANFINGILGAIIKER